MSTINDTRFKDIFARLTRDGATAAGGLDRPALSLNHLAARHTFRSMITECGFVVREDGAGNLSAVWNCQESGAPTLILGSHLDSVREGGRFDGTLGVSAAFEILQVLRESNLDLRMNVEVIDFTDEEGTWISLWGSRALTGQLTAAEFANPRGNPEEFELQLARAGLTIEGSLVSSRQEDRLAGYLELHIEQGTRLEKASADIGIVTGMVGIHMFLVNFQGTANHAGTTPMNERRDAAQGAAAFCLAVRTCTMANFTDCVATVGRMDFSPGAFNIVPERVTVFMELRSDDAKRANALEYALRQEAAQAASKHGLDLEFEHLETVEARKMDPGLCRMIESAADGLNLSYCRLPSLAGHDAQNMSHICPSGLLFVPSVGGYSHSSREYTHWEDCVAGANTLLRTAQALAAAP